MLVVGSVAFDTIHNASGKHVKVLGGSATYASLSGAFHTPVRLVGVVGTDYPEDAVRMFRDRGIDTAGLEVADGKTFHWEGRYSDDLTSRVSLATDLNVFADFHPKIPDRFRDTPYVMLGNIAPELQLEVLEQIRDPKLVIADTMNFWIEGRLDALKKVLSRIDLLVINEEESRQLAEAYNIVTVARRLLDMGPRWVVIKRGEYGAMLFDQEDEVFAAPAYPLEEVADPTGAGDSFAGGLLGFIAKRDDLGPTTLRHAVIHGSAVASFCVEGTGVERLLTVEREGVEARFEAFRKLAHFDGA
jgi:sugar/nucleoside kinase (ribokinase family)